MTKLHELFKNEGQSPWLDNLRRDYLRSGQLATYLNEGIRGVTSNPTIFAKAIESDVDYDEQFSSLVKKNKAIEDAYWDMVTDDVIQACDLLRPVYEENGHNDGFVSIEVSPSLAHDAATTIDAARNLHQRINRPNLLVKIPATVEGLTAIETMIAEGRSVNVTLIFGLDRYEQVIEAYMSGLEKLLASGDKPLSEVHSVASFFVSRVDTEVDKRLDQLIAQGGNSSLSELQGKAAVSQAKLAYQLFSSRFTDERFLTLAKKGASLQKPLWASTSTKNPNYPDLAYVDPLIGPDTINTMPEITIEAFLNHGTVERTVDKGIEDARLHIDKLSSIGISMAEVSAVLEAEGVALFKQSFDDLIKVLTDKAERMRA